ncbi:hypothetical protein RF11_06078 [Thelohanellus kitauei]|uniref:Uncharacterized protein n=1 Tax=Thelohanellus kitauei TaxID=669202 RepID=A0A0C2JLF7_THEKT|nr:hypothetical protein RF11_06078 [Thelohanellus kitauei]
MGQRFTISIQVILTLLAIVATQLDQPVTTIPDGSVASTTDQSSLKMLPEQVSAQPDQSIGKLPEGTVVATPDLSITATSDTAVAAKPDKPAVTEFEQQASADTFQPSVSIDGAVKPIALSWEALGKMSSKELEATFPEYWCGKTMISPYMAVVTNTGYDQRLSSLGYVSYRVGLCYYVEGGKDILDRAEGLHVMMRCSEKLIKNQLDLDQKLRVTLGMWQCLRNQGAKDDSKYVVNFIPPSRSEMEAWPKLSDAFSRIRLKREGFVKYDPVDRLKKTSEKRQQKLTYGMPQKEKLWPLEGSRKKSSYPYPKSFKGWGRGMKRMYKDGKSFKSYYGGKKYSGYGYPKAFPGMSRRKMKNMLTGYPGSKKYPTYKYPKAFRGMSRRKMKRMFKKGKMLKPHYGGKQYSPYGYPKAWPGMSRRKMKRMFKKGKMFKPYYGGEMYSPYGDQQAWPGMSRPKMKRMFKKGKIFNPNYLGHISYPHHDSYNFPIPFNSHVPYGGHSSLEYTPFGPAPFAHTLFGPPLLDPMSYGPSPFEHMPPVGPLPFEPSPLEHMPLDHSPYGFAPFGHSPYVPAPLDHKTYGPEPFEHIPYGSDPLVHDSYRPATFEDVHSEHPYPPSSPGLTEYEHGLIGLPPFGQLHDMHPMDYSYDDNGMHHMGLHQYGYGY